MSKLSEQLRERLNDYNRSVGDDCDYIANQMTEDVEALLTEHEKLEREAESGTNIRNELKRRISEMELNKEVLPPEFFNGYRQAYAEMDRTADHIYRTACEK